MRGVGQTGLMIANLPDEQCTIVVPSRQVGKVIAERVTKDNPGHRRYVVISYMSEVQKLHGLSEPIFFDHSFFDAVDHAVAREAVRTAALASYHRKYAQ